MKDSLVTIIEIDRNDLGTHIGNIALETLINLKLGENTNLGNYNHINNFIMDIYNSVIKKVSNKEAILVMAVDGGITESKYKACVSVISKKESMKDTALVEYYYAKEVDKQKIKRAIDLYSEKTNIWEKIQWR